MDEASIHIMYVCGNACSNPYYYTSTLLQLKFSHQTELLGDSRHLGHVHTLHEIDIDH